MTVRLHLLLGFLLIFGGTLFIWALLFLLDQFSLLTAILGVGAGSVLARLFASTLPAVCLECGEASAFKSKGIGTVMYHCRSCDAHIRTNVSNGSIHDRGTKVGYEYAQKQIGKSKTRQKVSLKKPLIRRLWDRIG